MLQKLKKTNNAVFIALMGKKVKRQMQMLKDPSVFIVTLISEHLRSPLSED